MVHASFHKDMAEFYSTKLLRQIQDIAPDATLASTSHNGSAYSLNSKDSNIVGQVLETMQAQKSQLGIVSYEIHGTAIEDIFLDLMSAEAGIESVETPDKIELQGSDALAGTGQPDDRGLNLTSGRKQSPLAQSLTIFYKRWLITRRSWLSSLLTVLIPVAGACIPLFFMNNRSQSCKTKFTPAPIIPLYLGDSPYSSVLSTMFPGGQALVVPPNLISTLGPSASQIRDVPIPDNQTFVHTVQQNYQNLSLGGVSMDFTTGNTLVAWEATPPGLTAPTLLNLASNVLYNRALNASGRAANLPSIIAATYQNFPAANEGTLFALKWVAFFGATMVSMPGLFSVIARLNLGATCIRVFILPFLLCTCPRSDEHPFKRCNCQMA
jgi:ATP-binding cassette, subfamily A (ABC1), member 3